MRKENFEGNGDEDSPAFDRHFKYGLIAYAVVEFIALAFVVCYELAK